MNSAPVTPVVVGLTTYGRDVDNRFYCPAEYVDAVRAAGAIALLLPPGERNVAQLLRNISGLVLIGGGDVDPARYGGTMHESIYSINSERDTHEFELARRVIDSGMPTLAICRGLQIVNIVLGGTLHEHVPDAVGERVTHRAPPRNPVNHRVEVAPDTRLGALTRDTSFECASWHHQAIARLAPDLRANAWADDKLIEGIELPGHPWLVGVQWHPELTAATDPIQQRIFSGFVAAAGAKR